MNQNSNEQNPIFTESDPCLDDQRPSDQLITGKPTANQLSDTQGITKIVPWTRQASSIYGRMEAAAWASDMYEICGGDGEGNAYLGDGISITPDGQLIDD